MNSLKVISKQSNKLGQNESIGSVCCFILTEDGFSIFKLNSPCGVESDIGWDY